MSYHPSGPEGLRLLAHFFEEVLTGHECFDFTEQTLDVEEDLRRWAHEMEEAQEMIWQLQEAMARKDRLIVLLVDEVQSA